MIKVYAIIAAIIVLSGLCGGLYYSIKKLGEAEALADAQSQAISIYAGEMEKANTARVSLENQMQVARDSEAKAGEIFNAHDIAKDIQAKPSLVAARATTAYGELFGSLEALTSLPTAPATASKTGQPTPSSGNLRGHP